jgi:hypothetical protein
MYSSTAPSNFSQTAGSVSSNSISQRSSTTMVKHETNSELSVKKLFKDNRGTKEKIFYIHA